MIIAIRVDASLQIGTGHVMRCLTLADELQGNGVQVVFICREHSGHLCDMVAAKGFDVIRLVSRPDTASRQADAPVLEHAAWLGTSQSADAALTIAALQDDAPWNWIIVDHYALDYRWESAMRAVVDKIMVIDDLADRKHDCDLLLDQNFFQAPEKRYQGLVSDKCQTLLGPRYALLRPEFREARKLCRMRGNGIARILVYFGGSDPDNLTGMALEALSDKQFSHLLVDAVIGPNNPHQGKLEKLIRQRPGTRLHIQPEGFTELMLRADLFIGAGGTTTWERLCLNLPSIVITVADNQKVFTKELDKAGYVEWIGDVENIDVEAICCSLVANIKSFNLNSLGFTNFVDGRGSEKVTETMGITCTP